MRFGSGALLALCAFGVSGCATFVDGTRQYIAISTPPTQSAYCVLTRPGGRWLVTTPGVLRIERSMDDLAIHCSRPGFQDASATIPSGIDGWAVGNLLVGVVPATVDAADGAMGSYPDEFELPMTPSGGRQYQATPYPYPSTPNAPARPTATHTAPLPGTLPENF